jgi:hypothetical protein
LKQQQLLHQLVHQLATQAVRVVANAAKVVVTIANARSLLTQSAWSSSTAYLRLLRVDVVSHSQLS